MKRKLIYLLTAALFLTGCSASDKIQETEYIEENTISDELDTVEADDNSVTVGVTDDELSTVEAYDDSDTITTDDDVEVITADDDSDVIEIEEADDESIKSAEIIGTLTAYNKTAAVYEDADESSDIVAYITSPWYVGFAEIDDNWIYVVNEGAEYTGYVKVDEVVYSLYDENGNIYLTVAPDADDIVEEDTDNSGNDVDNCTDDTENDTDNNNSDDSDVNNDTVNDTDNDDNGTEDDTDVTIIYVDSDTDNDTAVIPAVNTNGTSASISGIIGRNNAGGASISGVIGKNSSGNTADDDSSGTGESAADDDSDNTTDSDDSTSDTSNSTADDDSTSDTGSSTTNTDNSTTDEGSIADTIILDGYDLYTLVYDYDTINDRIYWSTDDSLKDLFVLSESVINGEDHMTAAYTSGWSSYFTGIYQMYVPNGSITTTYTNSDLKGTVYSVTIESSETQETREASVMAIVNTIGIESVSDAYTAVINATARIRSKVSYSSDYVYADMLTSLSDGYGVCIHYAQMLTVILNAEGVPCRTVIGYLNGGAHAWNEVYIDGEWVMVDVTNYSSGFVTNSSGYSKTM